MITATSFRVDFPEFSGTTYLDSAINFWIAVATIMLGATVVPNGAIATSSPTASGDNVLHFTSLPPVIAVGMSVSDLSTPGVVPPNTNVQSFDGTAHTITLNNNVTGGGVAAGDIIFLSGGSPFSPLWGPGSATPQNPPTTIFDIGVELFVAHNLALESQALKAAATGAIPGEIRGVVASKSVGGVSISYDTSAGIEAEAGHWNLTLYGLRFIKLARFMGSGPRQMNIGAAPPFTIGAWPGPWPFPQQGDSGFG